MPNEQMRTASDTLILHVALALFARGYDSTSIDDIRQATGLTSKATPYIQNKEEVVIPLLQQTMRMQNQKMIEAEQAVKAEPLHQLTASGHAFISRGLLHPQGYAFCFLRVQQDIFLQGRSTLDSKELHTPGHLLTGGLLPLRQTYPVRAIANAAFISLLVDALSSHKQLLHEQKVWQLRDVCFGQLFSEPITILASLFLSRKMSERSDKIRKTVSRHISAH